MGLFKDTHPFQIDGKDYQVVIKTSLGKDIHAKLLQDGKEVAHDDNLNAVADDRDFVIHFKLKDGRCVRIEAGWISPLKTAIIVLVDGKLYHESSPGANIMTPLEVYGLTPEDFSPPEQLNKTTEIPLKDSSTSDILDERDKTFDQLKAKRKGFTGIFLTAIVLVALWGPFTDATGIDIMTVASAVLISGLAAQLLLRIPTISGGALAIAAGLLLYGASRQYILNNDRTNEISFTLTSFVIVIGYIVYYLYYRKNDSFSKPPGIPVSEIRRSIGFFLFLGVTNALFVFYASDDMYNLWSSAVLIIFAVYIFSIFRKKRTPMQQLSAEKSYVSKNKMKKTKVKKKPDSDKMS